MSKIKVLISFSKYTDSFLVTLTQAIILAFTGNLIYPSPSPTIAALQTLFDNYNAALTEAKTKGGRALVAAKNQARLLLEAGLRSLAQYANFISEGNLAQLTTTAMPLSKVPSPRIIGTPANLRVSTGTSAGTLLCQLNADSAADSYMFMYTKEPVTEESVWASVTSTRSQYLITGLKSGTQYWVKVAVIGTNKQIEFSAAVSQYVQ